MIILALMAIIFIILAVSERLWRAGWLKGEIARKFVHILVGTFIAIWPHYISYRHILLMGMGMLFVITISQRRSVFHAINSVNRKTWGEYFFPLVIITLAIIAPEPWIFTAAVLHMSLADGLAAVIGTKYGKANAYKVFGYVKSLTGTAAFFGISWLIIILTLGLAGQSVGFSAGVFAAGVASLTAGLENVSIRGTDNLTIPLSVVLLLGIM